MTQHNVGKSWYNDGVKNYRAKPGDANPAWKKGFLGRAPKQIQLKRMPEKTQEPTEIFSKVVEVQETYAVVYLPKIPGEKIELICEGPQKHCSDIYEFYSKGGKDKNRVVALFVGGVAIAAS